MHKPMSLLEVSMVAGIIFTVSLIIIYWVLIEIKIDKKYDKIFYSSEYNVYDIRERTLTPKKKDDKIYQLLAGEREAPPRAYGFGKLDGEEYEVLGKYEEKYLNTFELKYWQMINAQKTPEEIKLIGFNN